MPFIHFRFYYILWFFWILPEWWDESWNTSDIALHGKLNWRTSMIKNRVLLILPSFDYKLDVWFIRGILEAGDCIQVASAQQTIQYNNVFTTKYNVKQSGAAEACWAHNPEVQGSKPCSASSLFWLKIIQVIFCILMIMTIIIGRFVYMFAIFLFICLFCCCCCLCFFLFYFFFDCFYFCFCLHLE